MITRNNLKWVFNQITPEQLEHAMVSQEDFVALEVYTSNTGSTVSLSSMTYSEEGEEIVREAGNIFCDKDTLLSLFIESGSHNPAFNDYI